MIIQEYNTVVI